MLDMAGCGVSCQPRVRCERSKGAMAVRTLWRDKLCEDRSRRELCPNFSAEFRRPSRAFSVERREMLYTVASDAKDRGYAEGAFAGASDAALSQRLTDLLREPM